MKNHKVYGLPYMGSKNQIAENLIDVLPSGKRFVDLFGGGGAMSEVASLSHKYNSVLYNDIQPDLVEFFKDVIEGKYKYEVFIPTFITLDEYHKKKHNDAYIRYVWGYGNVGTSYIFSSRENEMKSIHNYLVFNIKDNYIKSTFPLIDLKGTSISSRRLEWGSYIKKYYKDKIHLMRDEVLERLDRLQDLDKIKNIEVSCMDYKEYKYQDGDIVYCDIPYEDTKDYNTEFSQKEFYDWASSQSYEIYFSSYLELSDTRFYLIAVWFHSGPQFARINSSKGKKEVLYCNKPVKSRIFKQLSLF